MRTKEGCPVSCGRRREGGIRKIKKKRERRVNQKRD
jgi:hypothetical protein